MEPAINSPDRELHGPGRLAHRLAVGRRRAEVGRLHQPAHIGESDERAGQNEERRRPEPRFERSLYEIPLAHEARSRGNADQAEPADHHRRHGERHAPAEAVQGGEVGRAQAIGDRAGREEEPALHQRMVEDVDQRAGHPGYRGEADADAEIADLAHAGEREKPLQIGLEDGNERTREHGDQREREQNLGERQRLRRRSARRTP